jgi:hypothetical protein
MILSDVHPKYNAFMRMFTTLLVFIFCASPLFAQDSCSEMLLLADRDVELEYTVYDRKGKPCGVTKTKVILIEETKNGTVFHFESNTKSQKGMADLQSQTYYMRCYKDTLYMSMKSVLPSGTLENYKSMKLDMETTDLKMPRKPQEDTSLPNGDISVVVSSNGMRVVTLKANTKERKVQKKESVTTPAGTFECVKVSQVNELKVGLITNKTTTTTWYAPGMGMIKQETYDKKGKLDSKIELQKKV